MNSEYARHREGEDGERLGANPASFAREVSHKIEDQRVILVNVVINPITYPRRDAMIFIDTCCSRVLLDRYGTHDESKCQSELNAFVPRLDATRRQKRIALTEAKNERRRDNERLGRIKRDH